MSSITERLLTTLHQIEQASQGRPVTLVAVSKTQPIDALLQAYQAGQRCFGENKVQEARDKAPLLPADAELHLIGPLQSNKAKYCPGLFGWVHSLDRLEVAEMLSKKCAESGQNLKVLVQVNLSGEISKSGLQRADEVLPFCEALLKLPHLELKGLMTISHPDFDEAGNQRVFAQLRGLLESTATTLGITHQMDQLSMGMSHDWTAALKEGATLLRIGSAIFGDR